MSRGKKFVLIKVVLQAIPTYATSVYKLPMRLVNEFHSITRRFWWGSNSNKGTTWVAWDKICQSKEDGGLGFKNQHIFNQEMLAKQGWRLVQDPNSLMTRIMWGRSF